jgi:hypothetical protein
MRWLGGTRKIATLALQPADRLGDWRTDMHAQTTQTILTAAGVVVPAAAAVGQQKGPKAPTWKAKNAE